MNNPSDFRVLNAGEGPQDSRRDEAITPPAALSEVAGSIPSEALTDDDWQLVADATDCIVPGRVCEAVNNLLINRATVRAALAVPSEGAKP